MMREADDERRPVFSCETIITSSDSDDFDDLTYTRVPTYITSRIKKEEDAEIFNEVVTFSSF